MQRTPDLSVPLNWTGIGNRVSVAPNAVVQDFGWEAANQRVGGLFQRSTRLAMYADSLMTPKAITDAFAASGTFRFVPPPGGTNGTACIGWFDRYTCDRGWRPGNFLGFNLDGKGSGGCNVHMLASCNWLLQKFDIATIPNTVTPHTFTLAVNGNQYAMTLDGTTLGTITLTPEQLASGTTYDRFGFLNCQVPDANPIELYLEEVNHGTGVNNFATEPNWENYNNRVSFDDYYKTGAQNFGWRPGAVGGDFWRHDTAIATYLDTTNTLTFATPFSASGKLVMELAASDADMLLGWFRDDAPLPLSNFAGVQVGGPSQVGHYFAPTIYTSPPNRYYKWPAAIVHPDRLIRDWSISWNPATRTLTSTVNGVSASLVLTAAQVSEGLSVNRFGVRNMTPGGKNIRIWFSDLSYTV